jgi:RecA-family ATPase
MVLKGLDEGESDMRLLEFKKSQYGPVAASVTLRWRNGLFLPDAGISDFERAANEAKAEEVFVSILRRWFRDSLTVSNKLTARNYAPTVFGRDPEAKLANLSKRDFEAAMARLIDRGRIRVEVVGPASKQSNELRVVT